MTTRGRAAAGKAAAAATAAGQPTATRPLSSRAASGRLTRKDAVSKPVAGKVSKVTSGKASASKPAASKAAAGKAAGSKTAVKAAAGKTASKPAPGKLAGRKPSSGKPTAGKVAVGRSAVGKTAAGKAAAAGTTAVGKATTRKVATRKVAAGKAVSGRRSTGKLTATRPGAIKPAPGRPGSFERIVVSFKVGGEIGGGPGKKRARDSELTKERGIVVSTSNRAGIGRVIRVLHNDGFIRAWVSTSVHDMVPLPAFPQLSKEQMKLKMNTRPFLGGSLLALRKYCGGELAGADIEVSEDARAWCPCSVTAASRTARRLPPIEVKFPGGGVGRIQADTAVWRMAKETLEDELTRQDHHLALSSPESGTAIAQCGFSSLMAVSQQMRSASMPDVQVSSWLLSVRQVFRSHRGKELFHLLLRLPVECDVRKGIDCCMDSSNVLHVRYRAKELKPIFT